jgi:RNA polymerase sigma-70 factor (ECF subfamily)
MGRLRGAVGPAGAGGLTDADLLRRWVARRDEAAFEALLWRHAAAVLGLCRRVLGDAHEAEDAAQAAFLALARRAGSIGRRQAVGSWLYTVAYRAALRARAVRSRRGALAPCDLGALPARPAEDPSWRDLRPVLDEEVGRLPEKYRAAFVLCHVEGRTNEEAARELGCPVGTVLSRLARARQRLRERLTRRGVTLAATALAAALAGEASAAAVPGALVRSAARAAALAAAGRSLAGVVSSEVVALTEGVVRAMLLTKVKLAAAVVLGLVLLGGGGGVLGYRTAAGEPPGAAKEQPERSRAGREAPPDLDKLKSQLAEREKEVQALRDRVAALEDQLKVKTRELESAQAKAQDQADRARVAEQEARKEADAERQARAAAEEHAARAARTGREGAPDDPFRAASAKESQAAQAEQARDDVELLEAQLEAKRAQLKAAQLSLSAAQNIARAGDTPLKSVELATLSGQVAIREAELKEADVKLTQAKRRLAKLRGPAEPSPDKKHSDMGQRTAELEKRLDALKKELDGLRKELERR